MIKFDAVMAVCAALTALWAPAYSVDAVLAWLLCAFWLLVALPIDVAAWWPQLVASVTTDVSHPPDRRFWRFVIRDRDSRDPYLIRWSLKLWRGYIVRLHFIMKPDATPCCHDHPWAFWTFCVAGGYTETIEEELRAETMHGNYMIPRHVERREHVVRPLTVHYRPASFRHTITKLHGPRAITLLLTGPKTKELGLLDKVGLQAMVGLPRPRRAGARALVPRLMAAPDEARDAYARDAWAKLRGDGRYRVQAGSESGHCCFRATVMDALVPDGDLPRGICECWDMETAALIAAALNRPAA